MTVGVAGGEACETASPVGVGETGVTDDDRLSQDSHESQHEGERDTRANTQAQLRHLRHTGHDPSGVASTLQDEPVLVRCAGTARPI